MQETSLSLSLKVKVTTRDLGSTISTDPLVHPTAKYFPLGDMCKALAGKSNFTPNNIILFLMSQQAKRLSSPTEKNWGYF